MVSNEVEGEGQSIWWQSIQAGVYGVLANAALLMVLGDSLNTPAVSQPCPYKRCLLVWLKPRVVSQQEPPLGGILADRAVVGTEAVLGGGCFDLGPAGWRAVLVVSAADVTCAKVSHKFPSNLCPGS